MYIIILEEKEKWLNVNAATAILALAILVRAANVALATLALAILVLAANAVLAAANNHGNF